MSPKEFCELVVCPNFAAFHDNPGDIRLAINVILTLDALFGITFTALKKAGHPEGRYDHDGELKDDYADRSDDFKAFRDAAKAIKHGELTRNTAKLLVKSTKDIQPKSVIAAGEVMADWPTLNATAAYINLPDGSLARVKDVLVHSVSVAKQLLADLGTPVS